LNEALSTGNFTLIGEVPQGSDVARRVKHWLANLPAKISVAKTANAR